MTQQNDSFSAEKIADLARLEIAPAEMTELSSQLSEILEFVTQVESVELDDVAPFFGPAMASKPVRQDNVLTSLPREEALRNAPERDDEFYLVPPVFG